MGHVLWRFLPSLSTLSTRPVRLNKVRIIVEKILVRVYVYFLLLFFTYSSFAEECSLSPKRKRFLIKSSLYPVDDIKCAGENQKWFISNKRHIFKTAFDKKKLIENSPYQVDSLVSKRGVYQWHITNDVYLSKRKSRSIASTKEIESESTQNIEPATKPTQAFSVGLYAGSASITSTDALSNSTESTVSDLGYGLNLSWAHLWTDKVSFFVVGNLKRFDFRVANNRTILKSSVTHSYIGTGINLKFGARFEVTPEVGIGESLILTSNGGSSLSIDKIKIPTTSLSTKIKLITFKSGFSFDFNARAAMMLATDQKGIKTESSYYYRVGLGSSYDVWNKKLLINAGYTRQDLEVGTAKQVSKDIGLSVGLGWSF